MSEEENKSNNETPVESDSSVKKPKRQKKNILSKRKRQKKKPRSSNRNGKKSGRNGNKRRERHELPPNVDNLPPLSLHEMQVTEINDIKAMAEKYEVQEFAGFSKHQLIFELLKVHGRRGGPLQGHGVLEVLPDGFGFLRSP